MFSTLAIGLYPKFPARSHHARGRSDDVPAAMSYLELPQLAAPEAIVVVTALIVLAIGLATHARACNSLAFVGAIGLVAAGAAPCTLPDEATLFGGMLVITSADVPLQDHLPRARACARSLLARPGIVSRITPNSSR